MVILDRKYQTQPTQQLHKVPNLTLCNTTIRTQIPPYILGCEKKMAKCSNPLCNIGSNRFS